MEFPTVITKSARELPDLAESLMARQLPRKMSGSRSRCEWNRTYDESTCKHRRKAGD